MRILPQPPEIYRKGFIGILMILASLIYIFIRYQYYNQDLSRVEKTFLFFIVMFAIYLNGRRKGPDNHKL